VISVPASDILITTRYIYVYVCVAAMGAYICGGIYYGLHICIIFSTFRYLRIPIFLIYFIFKAIVLFRTIQFFKNLSFIKKCFIINFIVLLTRNNKLIFKLYPIYNRFNHLTRTSLCVLKIISYNLLKLKNKILTDILKINV
jgi:hypothetical protein